MLTSMSSHYLYTAFQIFLDVSSPSPVPMLEWSFWAPKYVSCFSILLPFCFSHLLPLQLTRFSHSLPIQFKLRFALHANMLRYIFRKLESAIFHFVTRTNYPAKLQEIRLWVHYYPREFRHRFRYDMRMKMEIIFDHFAEGVLICGYRTVFLFLSVFERDVKFDPYAILQIAEGFLHA